MKEVRIALLTAPSGSGKGHVSERLKTDGVSVLAHDTLTSQCRNMFRPNWKEHVRYGVGKDKNLIWEDLRREHDFSRLLGIIYREWWFRNGCPIKCIFEGWVLKNIGWRQDAKSAFSAVPDARFEFRLFTLRLEDLEQYAEQINRQHIERGRSALTPPEALESAKRQQLSFFNHAFEWATGDGSAGHEQHGSSESLEVALRRYLLLPPPSESSVASGDGGSK